jgi:hypothetical protein
MPPAVRFLVALAPIHAGSELAPPFLVEAAEGAIDVTGGNSAPFLFDLDGDGLLDLLVGQFDEGRVRLYPNRGERGAPRFADWRFLRAGEELLGLPFG